MTDVLTKASEITKGDRNQDYGEPDDNLNNTAALWSLYLGMEISGSDVAIMMILLKCSRSRTSKLRDNWVDIAGYARCGAICEGQNQELRDEVASPQGETLSSGEEDGGSAPLGSDSVQPRLYPTPRSCPEQKRRGLWLDAFCRGWDFIRGSVA